MGTAIVGLVCLACAGSAVEPSNVSGFRGPDRNGIYPAGHLLRIWPAEGPKLLWEIAGREWLDGAQCCRWSDPLRRQDR